MLPHPCSVEKLPSTGGAVVAPAHGSSASSSEASFPVTSSTSSRRRRKDDTASVGHRRLHRPHKNVTSGNASHVSRFSPHRSPFAMMLDPFPNMRINAVCMVGLDTLVTVHRNGLRLYREQRLPAVSGTASIPLTSPGTEPSGKVVPHRLGALRVPATVGAAASTPSSPCPGTQASLLSTTGVFAVGEMRQGFEVRESYLAAAMRPILLGGAVLLSKWSRYFCVASGSDRVVHSVSVMSSGAHFCLSHTKHEINKVACMDCCLLALKPFQPHALMPAVVSVDEVGAVVLFDVERESAVVLEQAPLWFRQTSVAHFHERGTVLGALMTGEERESNGRPHPTSPLLRQHLSAEEEEHVLDAMECVAVGDRVVYRLENGVATRVTLVGPCLELCNHCHNAFSHIAPSRGYTLVSLYLCLRARDVPTGASQRERANPAEGGDPDNITGETAELNVVLLRVLWGRRRAFVMEEVWLVQEEAPTPICEKGVAVCARPYQVGVPMTVLLARPALDLYCLTACTGELLEVQCVYGASGNGPCRTPRRASTEYFIDWIPLGRHKLRVRDMGGTSEFSWLCVAAVADDNTVLLLGFEPQGERGKGDAAAAVEVAAVLPAPQPVMKEEEGKTSLSAAFKDSDMEAWLDDIADVPCAVSTMAEESVTASAEIDVPAVSLEDNSRAGADGAHPPTFPYTILMELYVPAKLGCTSAVEASAPFIAGALSVLPYWGGTSLLLFRHIPHETLLCVPLPFVDSISTVTDAELQETDGAEIQDRNGVTVDITLGECHSCPSPISVKTPQKNTEELHVSGMASHVRGSTDATTSKAPWGWMPSVSQWTFPSAPRLPYFDGPGDAAAAPTASSKDALSSTRVPVDLSRLRVAAAAAPRAAESHGIRPPFSVTRPLVAAMLYLAGEGADEPSPSPAMVDVAGPPPESVDEGVPNNSSAMQGLEESVAVPDRFDASRSVAPSPSPMRESGAGEQRSALVDCATATLVVPIRVSDLLVRSEIPRDGSGNREMQRRRHHRASSHVIRRGVTVDSRSQRCTTPLSGPEDAANDSAVAQQSYIAAQVAYLTAEPGGSSDHEKVPGGIASPLVLPLPQHHYAFPYLLEVEEPLARNTVMYEWMDRHDEIYLCYSAACDTLQENAETEVQTTASTGAGTGTSTALLRIEDSALLSTAKRSRCASVPRLLLFPTANVEDGVHSMGFFAQRNAARARRAETPGYGTTFDFTSYFSTAQVPQHVLDVQERDKYRLELQDLRLQQAKDLADMDPYHLITIFQNEERITAESSWRPHTTFPYDDAADGSVVDVVQLNRTAGAATAAVGSAQMEWRWADTAETAAWAEEHHLRPGASSRVKSLTKELKDWAVGRWVYAERWPSREEEAREKVQRVKGGRTVWSDTVDPSHRCRRRHLTRLRVSIGELKRQQDLTALHQRELESLRVELDL